VHANRRRRSRPAPAKPPKSARRERAGWYRHLLAYAIATGLMLVLGILSGRGYDALLGPAGTWTLILGIDAIISFSAKTEEEEAPQEKQPV
jgi:hypothetical protein